MVKDEKPYINHDGIDYRCYLAGYTNPVQHKWSFVLAGIENPVRYGEKIDFMGLVLTVTFSLRRKAEATAMFNNCPDDETYLEAWQI